MEKISGDTFNIQKQKYPIMPDKVKDVGPETKMLKEILQEPSAIHASVKSSSTKIPEAVEAIKSSKLVYITGSGTSYHLGLIIQLNLLRSGIPAVAIRAPEFSHFISNKMKNAISILISQSGESADILECLETCKKMDIRTICITNTKNSLLAKGVDIPLLTDAGAEESVAATKSFVSGLVPAYLVLSMLNGFEGIEYLKSAAKEISEILGIRQTLEGLSSKFQRKIVFLGDGYLHPIAMEAALKFRETCNLTTDAYPVREYLHGPIQTLDNDTTVVIFYNDQSIIIEDTEPKLRQYTSSVFKIGTSNTADIVLNPLEIALTPFIFATVIQLLANFTSVHLGLNPDSPTHLSKIVK